MSRTFAQGFAIGLAAGVDQALDMPRRVRHNGRPAQNETKRSLNGSIAACRAKQAEDTFQALKTLSRDQAYDLQKHAAIKQPESIESGDLRIIVVNLHERDVADALVEHAVHSITHVWVCCGGGRVVIMMVMVVNVVHDLVRDLIGNPEQSETLRLRNHVEHLCPFAEQVRSRLVDPNGIQ